MNISPLIRILAAGLPLAVLASTAARAEFNLRPTVWAVEYAADGLESKIGGSIALSNAFGPNREHEVSVEAGSVAWQLDDPFAGPGAPNSSAFGRSGSGHSVPVFLNYRYVFGRADQRVRPFVGGTAGASRLSGDVVFAGSGVRYRADVDEIQATFGATIGIAARLTPRVSVDLSYRYLNTGGLDLDTTTSLGSTNTPASAGPTFHFPRTDAHVVALGLNCRF